MGRSSLIATILLVSSLTLGGAACTDADGAISILQNQVPEDGCSIPNDLGNFIPRGVIDTNARDGYLLNPLVQNNAVPSDTNDRTVIIGGAEVQLTLQDGLVTPSDQVTALTRFTSRFSGSVQADGAFTSFSFVVIPKDLLQLIAPALDASTTTEIKVEATIFGEIGGGDVETNKFVYWVDVCNGCMKVDQGPCADLAASFSPREGGICQKLQDIKLDCCTDEMGKEICPATPGSTGTPN